MLPILILPFEAKENWAGTWRDQRLARTPCCGNEDAGRRFPEEWHRTTTVTKPARQGARIRNKLISNVPLELCEVISKSVLKRWRAHQKGLWARVSRLARSCDEERTVAPVKGDAPAISWMLLVMFWRGSRHPLSLMQPAVHPFMGLLRWMLKAPSAQVEVDNTSGLVARVVAILKKLRRRAQRLTRSLLERARRTGRVRLTPKLLADEYWVKHKFAA